MKYLVLPLLFAFWGTFIPVKAQVDNYLKLDTNGYVSISNYSNVISLDTGTISMWIKVSDSTQGHILYSISNTGTKGIDDNEFYITLRSNGVLQLVMIDNGSVIMDAWTEANTFTYNSWHHLAFVFDGKGAPDVYIDATAFPLTAGTCCGGTTMERFLRTVNNVNNMTIGGLSGSSGMITSEAYSVDEFKIFNIPIAAGEISNLMYRAYIYDRKYEVMAYNFEIEENLSVGPPGTNDLVDNTNHQVFGDVIQGSLATDVQDLSVHLSGNAYVETTLLSSFATQDSGSISFWLTVNDLNNSNIIMSASNKGTKGVDDNEFYINYRIGTQNLQIVSIHNGVVLMDAWTPNFSIADNNAHFITVVCPPSGNILVYIDHVAQTLTAGTCCGGTLESTFFKDAGNLDNFRLGSLVRSNELFFASDIELDDFYIWGDVLSEQDVNALYNAHEYSQAGDILAAWNFDRFFDKGYGMPGLNDYEDFSGSGTISEYINGVTTGVTASVPTSTLVFYPNPAKDRISLKGDYQRKSYQLYNLQGILVQKGTLEDHTVILSGVSSGTYLLRIGSGNQWEKTTVIID